MDLVALVTGERLLILMTYSPSITSISNTDSNTTVYCKYDTIVGTLDFIFFG